MEDCGLLISSRGLVGRLGQCRASCADLVALVDGA